MSWVVKIIAWISYFFKVSGGVFKMLVSLEQFYVTSSHNTKGG